MTRPIWRFHRFDEGLKAHFVTAGYERALLDDLKARAHNIKATVREITECGLEWAGCMVHADRPWESIDIGGLEVHIPCEDVIDALDRVRKLPLRWFAGKTARSYYKLHDIWRCLVMRPHEKGRLEAEIVRLQVSAEQRALVFYADKVSPAEALRGANAHSAGVPPEQMPDFSGADGHRIDRFFNKPRGEA